MKHKKYAVILFVIFLAMCVNFIFGDDLSDSQRELKFEQLKEIASQKGRVRVIVKFDVPDIAALTSASSNYQTGVQDSAYIQQAYEADMALERVITDTTDSLLFKLNGSPYTLNRTFSTLPIMSLTVTEDTLEKLKELPEVVSVTEDQAIELNDTEFITDKPVENPISDPMLNQSTSIIGADKCWGFGYTGAGWYVAVLDTGILRTHEMFSGKSIVEQCYASGEDSDAPNVGSCPNGLKEMAGPGSAAHYEAQQYHGTHVASIAAGNNHSTLFGVAKDADIIAVNVFSYFSSVHTVRSWSSDQLKGLEFVYLNRNNYKIASVNMSLGGGRYYSFCDDDPLKEAVDNLRNVGIATVIASGNYAYCGSVTSPACISSSISVNATSKTDTMYTSGNFDSQMVSLLAPGVDINGAGGYADNDYRSLTGTSMATPHVAGAWALLKQFNENYSVSDILNLLKNTGSSLTSQWCAAAGSKPRINVANALQSQFVVSPPQNLTVSQVANHSLLQTEYINVLNWEANPYNTGKTINQYKIYTVQNSQKTLLAQVSGTTHTYLHRNVTGNQDVAYSITSVDGQGNESPAIATTLHFTL
ncbi:MAG: S8 family peptidase [Candidatus Omnitrophota bacterium]